ncbi:DUF6903 family protein [Erysipelothrix tonsillarum]|uniref:DUF6903 family protein n=1 Tax=Erysipelothrix tonsillarum TaxID=38402 RepID=UPI0003A13007|nr:hypothetical protein [Erysipelothrix tonsillarum]
MKKLFNGIANSVIFVLGLWMIIHFQKTISMQSLLMMLVGLGLLLSLLYRYNKRYI